MDQLEQCLRHGRSTALCGIPQPNQDHVQGPGRHSALWCDVQGWCVGNVSVIGDAAHAGLPNGQGLNLALEDGMLMQDYGSHPCMLHLAECCMRRNIDRAEHVT